MKYEKSTAKHEAAHFVVAWAVNVPADIADIRPDAQRPSKDPNKEILGNTLSFLPLGEFDLETPFINMVVTLAGPVARNWGRSVGELLESEKNKIEDALDSLIEDYEDDGDWYGILGELMKMGIDIKDAENRKNALLPYIKATQEILNVCMAQWQQLTEYLVIHGVIDMGTPWYEGDNDWRFVMGWYDDDNVPRNIRDCVEKHRIATETGAV